MKRMIMKLASPRQIFLAAVLCAVSACSNDEQTTDIAQTTEGSSILFSSTAVAPETATRAAADTYNNSLPESSQIGVFIYDCDNIDLSTNVGPAKTWVYQTVGAPDPTTRQSALKLTSHPKNPKYPFKDGSTTEYKDWVEVVAVFPVPKDAANNDAEVTPSTTSYTFSVSDDQTTEDNIKGSDLLTSDRKQYTYDDCNGQLLSLKLYHRMAKVQVEFTPKSGSDLTAANMPAGYDVLNVQRSVTIVPRTGALTTSGDKTTTVNPLKGLTTDWFFIPPQTVDAGTELLQFEILPSDKFKGINGATFKVPDGGITFQAGHTYKLAVTVDVDLSTLTGTIQEWSEETMTFEPIIL